MREDGVNCGAWPCGSLSEGESSCSRCIPQDYGTSLLHGGKGTLHRDRVLVLSGLESRLVDDMQERHMFGLSAGKRLDRLDPPLRMFRPIDST
jgi:hypothetical protein